MNSFIKEKTFFDGNLSKPKFAFDAGKNLSYWSLIDKSPLWGIYTQDFVKYVQSENQEQTAKSPHFIPVTNLR